MDNAEAVETLAGIINAAMWDKEPQEASATID